MIMTTAEALREMAGLIEKNEALKARVAELEAELKATQTKVPTEVKQWFTVKEAAQFIGRSDTFLHKDRMVKMHKERKTH